MLKLKYYKLKQELFAHSFLRVVKIHCIETHLLHILFHYSSGNVKYARHSEFYLHCNTVSNFPKTPQCCL